MSGGHFDYDQYKINSIVDIIEQELNQMGTLKPKEDLLGRDKFYKDYPEEKYYQTHPHEVVEKIKEGLKVLKLAAIYAQRIDWFLSGDDGDESFIRRLQDDIEKMTEENNGAE